MDEYSSSGSTTSTSGQPQDTSILSKPVGALLEYKELDILPSEKAPDDHVSQPIQGAWLGLTVKDDGGWRDPFFCVIHPLIENAFTATGEAYFGTLNITNGKFGSGEPSPDGRIKVTFDLPDLSQTYEGIYDPQKEVVEGTYIILMPDQDIDEEAEAPAQSQGNTEPEEKDGKNQVDIKPVASEVEEGMLGSTKDTDRNEDANGVEGEAIVIANTESSVPDNPASTSPEEDQVPVGRFYMRRTPPDVFRFRYLLDGPGPAPCWNIWPVARKRWAFAVEAILYQTRLRMGSRKAFLEILAERRRWLTYCQRYYLTDSNTSSRWFRYEPLSDAEWEEYKAMLWSIDPTAARLHETIGLYLMTRGKWNV